MFSVTTLRQLKLSLIITGGQDLRLLGRCGHCFIKCSMAQTFVDKTLHLRHVSGDVQLHRGRMGKSHLLNADPDT